MQAFEFVNNMSKGKLLMTSTQSNLMTNVVDRQNTLHKFTQNTDQNKIGRLLISIKSMGGKIYQCSIVKPFPFLSAGLGFIKTSS